MFKWPGIPSPRAAAHELADFAELSAWQEGSFSLTALSRILGQLDENDPSAGVSIDDPVGNAAEAAYAELEQRAETCGHAYPFVLARSAQTLSFPAATANDKHIIYQYLLLATRLNMDLNRVRAGIDGTRLFEELAAEIARIYLGDRAQSFVFGTASQQPGFRSRVDDLCRQLGEGGGFIDRSGGRLTARDGKLDVVAWKPFADGRPGKLILFGQCKTGTSYRDTLAQLQPEAFCKKWVRDPLDLAPVRAFFIAEALPLSLWHDTVVDAGLLFDRCRIIDFADSVNSTVLRRLTAWTTALSVCT